MVTSSSSPRPSSDPADATGSLAFHIQKSHSNHMNNGGNNNDHNNHNTSKQARMRAKAEEINLVLLEPDVDLWKLRELALSDGGLVNGKYCILYTMHAPSFWAPREKKKKDLLVCFSLLMLCCLDFLSHVILSSLIFLSQWLTTAFTSHHTRIIHFLF